MILIFNFYASHLSFVMNNQPWAYRVPPLGAFKSHTAVTWKFVSRENALKAARRMLYLRLGE